MKISAVNTLIAQAVVAETNLVRLALAVEGIAQKSRFVHDLVHDCIVSASIIRTAREAAEAAIAQ